jgi:hypothetical protein
MVVYLNPHQRRRLLVADHSRDAGVVTAATGLSATIVA